MMRPLPLHLASEELARHRWHWTLDESNPDRVSFSEYAAGVGRHKSQIQSFARGYALKVASEGCPVVVDARTIGCPGGGIALGLIDQEQGAPLEGERPYTDMMERPASPADFTKGYVYACKASDHMEFALFGEEDTGRYESIEVARRALADMPAIQPATTKQAACYRSSDIELEPQIERIYDRQVALPSGGSIVIDRTEALVAIDVNSGRSTRASSQEETALNTNLEAAAEVARQLRLRDIGGLIVVDFIDMQTWKSRKTVEKTLRDAMKSDKARSTIGRISPNGLLEVNRQRIQQALHLRTHRACPTCSGTGRIASPEMVGLSLFRKIEARGAAGFNGTVRVALHPELADSVQNKRRRELADLRPSSAVGSRSSPRIACTDPKRRSSGSKQRTGRCRYPRPPVPGRPPSGAR